MNGSIKSLRTDKNLAACISVSLMVLSLLACSTGSSAPTDEFKLGFMPSDVSKNQERSERVERRNASVEPERKVSMGGVQQDMDHALGEVPPPSRAHLELARSSGLPLLTDQQRMAGPFEGAPGSLIYIDSQGKVSAYMPEYRAVYFGRVNENRFTWLYGASLMGYFAFDQDYNFLVLGEPPEQLVQWPFAVEIAQQIADFATRYIEYQGTLQAGGDVPPEIESYRGFEQLSQGERDAFWASMTEVTEGFARLGQQELASIGGRGCIAHYLYTYYVGCY